MSPSPPILTGLSRIAPDYDAMLCDVWGVVHDGRSVFPGVEEALTRFRESRGPVVLLTNAPRPSAIIPPQLDRLGLSREAYDAVVTSGDATAAELKAREGQYAFRLGPEKDDPLYEGLTMAFSDLEDAEYIICTGLIDDARDRPEDYRSMLAEAKARDLPMVCANPDVIVKFGDRTLWCAGALAQIYRELGGRVILTGKPHRPIYQRAYEALATIAGRTIEKKRILAVGDGLGTDIAGANAQGLDAVFVADGIHGDGARGASGALDADALEALFEREGRRAVGALERLVW